MDWIMRNKDWLFSGIAVAIPLAIIGWVFNAKGKKQVQISGNNSTNIQVAKNITFNSRNADE